MFSSINQRPAQNLPIQNSVRPADVPEGLNAAVDAVKLAFKEQPALRDGLIQKLTSTYQPSDSALFKLLSSYVSELKQRVPEAQAVDNGPARKRRKIEGEAETVVNGSQGNAATKPVSLDGAWSSIVFEGVSFSVPQRKKLQLEISSQHSEGVRAVNPTTKATEFGVPWGEIEHVCCLPVPEKAQASRNFCIFPKGGDGLSNPTDAPYEPIVWTALDTLPRTAGENEKTAAQSILDAFKAAKIKVQEPTETVFASEIPEPHRKGEKAYHVKAFRGSKDGYLFFLPKGILWGFKKPLMFFSFATIDSVSYTNVLSRTFNLDIAARPVSSEAEPVEYEFSMLDQADFAGIDEYIKKNKLQDASMAEERRARRLNINAPRGQKGEGSQNVEEESELRKAEQEAEHQALQDEDDDEEDDENFDPGSDGESEGSGTDDDDDDDSGDEGGGGGDDDDDDDDEDESDE